jgi:hypothetical protein
MESRLTLPQLFAIFTAAALFSWLLGVAVREMWQATGN